MPVSRSKSFETYEEIKRVYRNKVSFLNAYEIKNLLSVDINIKNIEKTFEKSVYNIAKGGRIKYGKWFQFL